MREVALRLPSNVVDTLRATLADPIASASVHPRLLPLGIVLDRTGLSKATIYRLIKVRRFPAPVKVTEGAGDGASRWVESEVNGWIAKVVRARNDATAAAIGRQASSTAQTKQHRP